MKSRRDSQMARLHKKLQAEETSRVFARLADTFRRSDHLEEAIELCHRGLVHHPEYVSGHIVLGQCYLDLGRLEEARDCFVRALALDENNILTLRSLGDIMVQQGELEEAVGYYHRALRLEPHNRDLQGLLREAEARLAELNAPPDETNPGGKISPAAEAVPSAGSETGEFQGLREGSPKWTDPPADEGLSGTAMMSVPAFGREVLEPTDTEEHRRWLWEMTRGPEGEDGDPDDAGSDPQEESQDPEDETGESEAAGRGSPAPNPGTGERNPGSRQTNPEFDDPDPDSGDALDDAHLSPEETELLRDEQAERTAKGPPRGMATATLAEIYFQQGYLDKAIEVYQKVLRHDPGDERSRTRLSELRAMRAGRSEDPEEGEPSA